MIKGYVKINGMWVQAYEVHGWYDLVCWACVIGIAATVGILLWRNLLW